MKTTGVENQKSAIVKLQEEMGIGNALSEESEGGIIQDSESSRLVFTKDTTVSKDVLETKPLYSPSVERWLNNGGEIIIENGDWIYTDPQGVSVVYKNGYPDFKLSGHVMQEVDIGAFQNRSADFRLADQIAPNGAKSPDSTWHHHQDGQTLQEVNRHTHAMFTHKGGISLHKKGGK